MSPRNVDKSDKGVYSIHGVTASQYSVNTNPASYGSNDFLCKSSSKQTIGIVNKIQNNLQ